jgi:hypothetical protein
MKSQQKVCNVGCGSVSKGRQTQVIADIKTCRQHIFKLCRQHMRLTKQKKRKEAANLRKQINDLTKFLRKVEAVAFI